MPDTLGADGGIANDWKRGMMFDKRLFSLADGVGRLIAAKVACQWLGLVANIAFVVAVVRMLQPLFAPVPSATAPCIAIILIAAVVRFVTIRAAARFGSEAAERVKLALREKLFNKMLALGPSYAQRVRTAGVVQSAGEGIEQIQSFFELFLPQLCYAVLAPITLFAVLAPIDLPTAATLLACAPLIVLIVGMVAMRAARVFKKYWGKYTDMGAAFLDNLQGLETLKTFDADERAARVMDEKAEQFRVMTMNVLQIQLRSLTAMDAVAYGGAAAGIGVAIWRFVSGSLSPSGVFALSGVLPLGLTPIAAVLLTILLAADFFIPLRQLGSYFHVAMNGMTSTKRIFRCSTRPNRSMAARNCRNSGLPGVVSAWSFVVFRTGMRTRMWMLGVLLVRGLTLPGLRVPVLRVPVVYRPHRIPICGTRMRTALMRAAARVTRAKRATPCATWPSVRCPAKSLRSSGHPVPASPQPSSCLPARLSDMKAMCCCPKCHPECRTKCWALC